MNKLPEHRAHLGRHGHNLTHDFSFTSGTGHLLTLMGSIMYPKDTIEGNCEMFTRTQPLLNCANVEIDEYIDYFFVPLDMLLSGFGDFIYQVNEPYSSITKANLIKLANNDLSLPVFDFDALVSEAGCLEATPPSYPTGTYRISNAEDYMHKDNLFFSMYRSIFHAFMNPNAIFKGAADDANTATDNLNEIIWPVDLFQPNILPLYQMALNCAYEHIYRIDDREEFDPSIYNIDKDVYDSTSIFSGRAAKFFSLKYRPKHFDYFTSVNPRPFVNSSNLITSNAVGANLTKINNYMTSQGIIFSDSDQLYNDVDRSNQLKIDPYTSTLKNTLNTGSFRSMFAVEKLLSITQRAKKTYDAQVMAHLGVDVPHDVLHQIIKVGSQHSQIRIGEVVATAGTTDTPLGDIAGKGYAVMPDKGIKFTAPCHGVFIGVYSAVPRFRYYAPLEKHAQISSLLDFFIPEYEKLGLQPVYGYEATALYRADGTPDTTIEGWQMRYEQYKRRFNRVSPAFVDTLVRDQTSVTLQQGTTIQTFNGWHNWTVVRRPYEIFKIPNVQDLTNRAPLDWFYCGPDELNGLMAVDYYTIKNWLDDYNLDDVKWYLTDTMNDYTTQDSFIWNISQLFYRDPLVHFCKPNFKIINEMLDNTLPDFID